MSRKKVEKGQWIMLSQRQRISPFPNYMSIESMTELLTDYFGVNLKNALMVFKDRLAVYFHHVDGFEEVAREIVAQLKNDPSVYARLVDLQNENGPNLVNFCKEKHATDLSTLTNEQLYDVWVEYERLYKLVYASYGSIWVMEDYLNEDLYNIIESKETSKKSSDVLNVLTAQPSAMVAGMHKRALLRLAVSVAELPEQRDDLVKAHVEEWYWVTRDYEDPIFDETAANEALDELLKGDPSAELETRLQKLEDAEQERITLLNELSLSAEEQALFDAMRDAAHLKELRKRYVAESLYHFDPVLKEIAKRSHLALKQVRFLRTSQLKRLLIDGEDVSEEVNEQIKLSLWQVQDGKETIVTVGEEAQTFYDTYCIADPNATEFSGMAVSPGKAIGPIKIVMNPDECDKVEEGDVIVSVQVTPSFSTAIIKAAAIVCDGGHGITSHPATLAREADIPGVIQTRFVREVFKDGDMVEVDGYEGVVRKVAT